MTSLPAVRRVPAQAPAEFERVITDAALCGEGWPELLSRIAAATGRHCRLVDPVGELLASTDEGAGLRADEASRAATEADTLIIAADGWRARGVRARAGSRVRAVLLIADPVGPRQLELARVAVTALLIESVRRSANPVTRFEDGALLIAALRGGTRVDESAAARFGVDVRSTHCAAVLRYTGSHHRTWATAIAWLDRPVERDGAIAYTLVADHRELSRIRARLERTVGAGTVLASCGSRTGELRRYRQSFAEAERLSAELTRRGVVELAFHDAGLLQVLLAVPDDRLRRFADRHLGPVLDRPELLATLRLWLASGGSRQTVSEQLHLHRNTVGYRVGQLKSLLGLDPLDPAHAAALHAALAAHDLLTHDSPFPERVLTTSRVSK